MTQPNVPVSVRLEDVVGLLVWGDERAAKEELSRGGEAAGLRALVEVMSCLRRVANCQWLQCGFGDVEAALRELDRATETLLPLCAKATGGDRLLISAEPARGHPLPHLVWATTRLVVRERADLEALRLIFSDITRGSRELVYACARHLTSVESDPWIVRVHWHDLKVLCRGDDAYVRFRTANPRDISSRATNLRQLAGVRTGSVEARTWQRMSGYAAVREGALLVLASDAITRHPRPAVPLNGVQDVGSRIGSGCRGMASATARVPERCAKPQAAPSSPDKSLRCSARSPPRVGDPPTSGGTDVQRCVAAASHRNATHLLLATTSA